MAPPSLHPINLGLGPGPDSACPALPPEWPLAPPAALGLRTWLPQVVPALPGRQMGAWLCGGCQSSLGFCPSSATSSSRPWLPYRGGKMKFVRAHKPPAASCRQPHGDPAAQRARPRGTDGPEGDPAEGGPAGDPCSAVPPQLSTRRRDGHSIHESPGNGGHALLGGR